MCGIAGHFSTAGADAAAVRRMMSALGHRGPDGEGMFTSGPVALGHRRLSIIDVEGGAQPISNEDGSITVVFNGEIYNYRELADDLRQRHNVRTSSDTEVLVHLYEEVGDEVVGHLRGMFAFALWDARRRRMLAARDRLGKKPLIYVRNQQNLWFASELRALEAAEVQLGSVDREALSQYLELLYIPAPRTIWSQAKKLPAGHFLVADDAGVRVRRYWAAPQPGSASAETALRSTPSAIAELLNEATRLRLRSDVPVGVLLSGGLDSSVVAALAARNSATPIRTFSVGFGRSDDELPIAAHVARSYSTEHHEIVICENVLDATTRALAAFSEPFGDSSAVPCSEVFREVGRHVKVVLTGDGGDELFAGYDRYRLVERLPLVRGAAAVARGLDLLPPLRHVQRARRGARALGCRGPARYRAILEVFPTKLRRALLGFATHPAQFGAARTLEVDTALDFDLNTYLPDDLLVKTDITSMMWGVEARCPLLDQVLVEQVVPLPASLKQDAKRGKLLLRQACGELLPDAVLSHPKRGFGSPVEEWLRGPLLPLVGDLLLAPRAKVNHVLDPRAVEKTVSPVVRGHGNGHQVWALVALATWLDGRGR